MEVVGDSTNVGASAVLLTTFHLQRDGTADLLRLVESVQSAIDLREVGGVRHLVLVQGCSPAQRKALAKNLPPWVELLSTPESLSSPDARNALIAHCLKNEGFDQNGFIAFPDDDAWYPSGTLACVARHFAETDIQLLLTRYGPSPSAQACDRTERASLQLALTNGACATIFIRGGLLARVGGFHPLLGLGTELCGGEDTEFVHRAFHVSDGKVVVVPGVLVGHATADPKRKAQYYEGALAALIAHGSASAQARLAAIRKIAVGLWLILKGHLTMAQYRKALRRANVFAGDIRHGAKRTKAQSPKISG